MKKRNGIFNDREQTLIKKAILTYNRFMKIYALVDNKRTLIRLTDFTLGELARVIRKKVGTSDEIVREMYEVLQKNKNEVVVLV